MQSRYENYVEYNLSESGVDPMAPGELLADEAARAAFLATRLGYCQSNGTEALRDRIATFYPGATRANVLVTNGGSEANYATLWSLLEPGDRVAYMLPNYLQTWGLSRAQARRADVFRLTPADDGRGGRRWALDLAGLERAVGPKTRLIMITNPNNPTGAVLTSDEMDAVARIARRERAWIVADEIYRGAELEGPETPSFWGRYDKVLVTSGLSKAFGLPGLRIGWIVGPAGAIEKIWSYRDYTTIAPGTLSDVLARYHLPIASTVLAERLRVEKSVLIVPGDQLGVPRHLRIGFGYGGEDGTMQGGLARIDEMLRAIAARAPAQKPARSRALSAPGGSARRRARPRGR
jgi:aspartate/methionine/tyrosine aminotransferase